MNQAELIEAEIRKIQEQLRGSSITIQDRLRLSRWCELLKQRLAALEEKPERRKRGANS